MRLNGRARLITDPALCESFSHNGKLPRSIIEFTVARRYLQCQNVLVRCGLWDVESSLDRSELPTAGQMAQALAGDGFKGAAYDRDHPEPTKKNALLSHFDECEAARDQRFALIISARLFSGSCRILRR